MITIKDIAKKAGVSYSTVSRALNDHPGTKEETKVLVRRIARELGYAANDIARSLVTSQTHTIGFVVPDLGNPVYVDLLTSIGSQADELGYSLLICVSYGDPVKERKQLEMMVRMRVDGLLLHPTEKTRPGHLENIQIPLIVFGEVEMAKIPNSMLVEIDNYGGSLLAVEHMIANGYEDIVYIGGPEYSLSTRKRLEAYRASMKKHRLEFTESDIIYGDFTIEGGIESTQKLLERRRKNLRKIPDAFICANDLIALGCLDVLGRKGLTAGSEVGVIGYDCIRESAYHQIQLSSVRVPLKDMGEHGVRMLVNRIEAKESRQGNSPWKIVLYPDLVVRKTSCKDS